MSTGMKPRLKYRLVPGRNPMSGEETRRPLIADRRSIDAEGIVEYALAKGYVIGSPLELRYQLAGFVDTMRSLVSEGVSVNLCDWLRIHGELSGTVGTNGRLSEKNEFRVLATPLKSAKCRIDDFDWERV